MSFYRFEAHQGLPGGTDAWKRHIWENFHTLELEEPREFVTPIMEKMNLPEGSVEFYFTELGMDKIGSRCGAVSTACDWYKVEDIPAEDIIWEAPFQICAKKVDPDRKERFELNLENKVEFQNVQVQPQVQPKVEPQAKPKIQPKIEHEITFQENWGNFISRKEIMKECGSLTQNDKDNHPLSESFVKWANLNWNAIQVKFLSPELGIIHEPFSQQDWTNFSMRAQEIADSAN